jgi:2,3-bisphosphoglycerate-dependent phosphoglycerate mutase
MSYINIFKKINLPYLQNVNKSIIMIRHGESIWNHDSKFTGWTNIPLSEKGKEEAKIISKSLIYNGIIPNIIFSSVLNRTIDTSNIIKKEFERNGINNDIQILTSWRLNEKHYGTLEGIPRKYIRDNYGSKFTKMLRSNFYIKPPILNDYQCNNEYSVYKNCYYEKIKFGESKENVYDRVLPYYENDILYTISENKFPLIVTHKHTLRVLMKHLLKINDIDFENYEIPSKKILLINLDDKLDYKNHNEISY